MTKREAFAQLKAIAAVAANTELVQFIDHEVELLDKKNSHASGKQTKSQIANEAIKLVIAAKMEAGVQYRAGDVEQLLKADYADMTNQKASALLKQMVEAGILTKVQDKKTSYFVK